MEPCVSCIYLTYCMEYVWKSSLWIGIFQRATQLQEYYWPTIYRAAAAVVSTITSLWTGLWSSAFTIGVGRGKSEKACRQTFGTRGGVNVFPQCIAIVFLTRWRSFPSHVVFLRSFCVKPNQVRGNQLQSLIFSSFRTFRVASRNLPFSVIPFTKITRALRKTSSMHPWPKGRID